MSRIVLVRHGETIWHAENRYAGRTDIELTAKGIEQAKQLGMWAAGAGLTGVWSSPLSRARLTALQASDAANIPLRIDDRLMELDFGSGEGLTDAEMEERFPDERAAFKRNPVKHHLPGGEDPVHAAERGVAALRDIAGLTKGRSLVVAHTTLIRLVLCQLLGIQMSLYRGVFPHLANATLTEIDLSTDSGNVPALLSFNAPLSQHSR